MLLTPKNSTNPAFWGLEINTENQQFVISSFPKEFYFDWAFLKYKWVYGLSLFKRLCLK